jgi:hypothetical protein
MKNWFNKLKSDPWREILLAFFSVIIGVFAGPLLAAIVPPLFKINNLPYIAFAIVSILFLVTTIATLTFWESIREQIIQIKDDTNELATNLGHRIKTLPYSQGYKELRKRIQSAKKEIIILTRYVFDWENKKPVWHPERLNSSERKTFYAELQKKLNRERKNENFKFVKIIQIPDEHQLHEILKSDPVYAQNCKFVIKMMKIKKAESTSLRVSRMTFGNSIILIDEAFAHISFDIYDPEDSKVEAPFIMVIDDPDSQSLQYLIRLCRRVYEHSTLVNKLV